MDFGAHGTILGDLGTILGRFWEISGTRQDTVRSRLGFYGLLVDLGDPFREVFGYIWTEKHDFFISISRLLFRVIFGLEFGCPRLQKQAFCVEGIAKINVRRN